MSLCMQCGSTDGCKHRAAAGPRPTTSGALAVSLDDHLAAALRPQGAPDDWALEDSPWEPDDEGAADWTARKLLAAKQTLADKQRQRDMLVEQADRWLAAQRKPLDDTVAWAERLLGVWLTREIAADESKKPKKSRALPSGVTVKQIAGRETLQVDDETAFLDWAKANAPELVSEQVVWKWSKADVKTTFEAAPADDLGRAALVNPDGEPVPGVHVERSADDVKVVTP